MNTIVALNLSVGPVVMEPCCRFLSLPVTNIAYEGKLHDGEGNRWEYAECLEAPSSRFTYERARLFPASQKEVPEIIVPEKKWGRIDHYLNYHTQMSSEGSFFMLPLARSSLTTPLWQFWLRKEDRWVPGYSCPAGSDFQYLPKTSQVVLMDVDDEVVLVDLNDNQELTLLKPDPRKEFYKGHLSVDLKHLLVVRADSESTKQTFWIYTFHTGQTIELEEGSNQVSEQWVKSLDGAIFPLDMTRGFQSTEVPKSLKVSLTTGA